MWMQRASARATRMSSRTLTPAQRSDGHVPSLAGPDAHRMRANNQRRNGGEPASSCASAQLEVSLSGSDARSKSSSPESLETFDGSENTSWSSRTGAAGICTGGSSGDPKSENGDIGLEGDGDGTAESTWTLIWGDENAGEAIAEGVLRPECDGGSDAGPQTGLIPGGADPAPLVGLLRREHLELDRRVGRHRFPRLFLLLPLLPQLLERQVVI
ncbi:hypothetical protein DENSPDRAFT_50739 [Dentipellis sp. KUC8613]|nr:hypothetical protein DENSPDRAFT_50739 [Dentipellis sp. KUC8613]